MNQELYRAAFVRPSPRMPGVLYEPVTKGDKSHIGVLVMHSDNDYLDQSTGPELAKRGYTVLCANPSDGSASLSVKVCDVKQCLELLKHLDGIEKIVLMGHSGGATLMSAYQNLAENGVKTFQGPEKLIKFPDFPDGFPPADGLMCLDSNWGNGAMRLFGVDPAIVEEGNALVINESLNMFNPANGYSPEGCTYSEEFLKRFFKAQSDRNNRLIDYALERLAAIEAGKGMYADDEPMIIAGSSNIGPNNKLFPQDPRLLSRTKEARTLLHKDGVITNEIVHTVRKPKHLHSWTGTLAMGALNTTVKKFLDYFAVRSLDGYGYDACEVHGIDWKSSYNCTPGNVMGITSPMLIVAMTAGYEFSAAETIYNNAASADKTIAFVEGANHDFFPEKECERFEGEFGDTVKTLFDYVDQWLSARFL
ncbi:MAG: alpha/beta hydrolase [Oscillospiraceae bacterium]